MKTNHAFNVPFLYNPGLLAGKLPDDLLKRVKNAVNHPNARTPEKSYSEYLVVNISGEYRTPEIVGLRDYINDMYITWKDLYKTPDVPYAIDPIWTNYMRKGDFNPIHNHNGELAVFVIWVTIPYDLNEELNYNKRKSAKNNPSNSCFEFTYNTYDGRIVNSTVLVDKSMEGTITMFPATMMHAVYPFYTSNEERISIAGNISKLNKRD